jgi:prophage regulatory protein
MPQKTENGRRDALDRLLRTAEVVDRTSLSKSKIYEAITAGEFPKPIRRSVNRVAFLESDVAAWIAAKIEAAS